MQTVIFNIPRISCGHCVHTIKTEISEIEGVESVLIVTGPYDIIVLAQLEARSKYKSFVNDIHDIEDITRTETCLAI